MFGSSVRVGRCVVQSLGNVEGLRASLAAICGVVALSCSPAPGPVTGEPEPGGTARAVATQASSGSSAPATSSAPALMAAPSAAPLAAVPSNRADKTSFECGDKRCAAGKETCCMAPALTVKQPPLSPYDSKCVEGAEAGPHIRDLSEVYSLQCKSAGPGKLMVFSRCDESQDCGPKAMCCHRYTDSREASAHRCLPFAGAGAGPCPGEELCVVGGEPCRTPGAECIADKERPLTRCIKKPKNPDHVCDTAADCLAGQRCLHYPGLPPECADRSDTTAPVPCTTHAECQAMCTDKRGVCSGLGSGAKDAYPLCKCP